MIIDYSVIRPPVSQLKAIGVTAVGRYIGWDSVPGFQSIGKNITKAEAAALVAAGIQVFLAFEYRPDAAASGASQGSLDAGLARNQLEQIGAPPDMAVYFAVDFDIPDYAPHLPDVPANALAKLGPVGEYFTTIRQHQYPFEIGGYGGYYAVKRLLDAGLIVKGWQTVAWSGGQIESRVVLYQVGNPTVAGIFGADVDVRENGALVEDFGQWPRPHVVPAQPSQEEFMPIVLDHLEQNQAIVLPVPTGKSKVLLFADYGFGPSHDAPIIRVGSSPTWNNGPHAEPKWGTPATVDLPTGTTEVTIGRVDIGDTPITVDFA